MTDEFIEFVKHVPMRLSSEERRLYKICESVLKISDYTTKIDQNYSKRVIDQITELNTILSGIVLCSDYEKGQELMKERNLEENEEFFKKIFEVGRRYKMNNPEKMRSEYGKLVYILQDSQNSKVKEEIGLKLIEKVKTVYDVLEKNDLLKLLRDEDIIIATSTIVPLDKSRREIQKEIKKKEAAIEKISKEYSKYDFDSEKIKQCLYSIGDANSYLYSNLNPIIKLMEYLKLFEKEETDFSLSIEIGTGGSRLTHSHEKQYQFVSQTLLLWYEIIENMFLLWSCAELDLFDSKNEYQLKDTGQGLNRVQYSPKVLKEMEKILFKTKNKLGSWIGESTIHLGDDNVPNSLMFIDKYTQIQRMINPVIITIDQLNEIYKDKGLKNYIDTNFKSLENCKKIILLDLFKFGYDGSGAETFNSAGSCLDGRLTSLWNWCSKLNEKLFYPIFKLTGFIGFDGEFS